MLIQLASDLHLEKFTLRFPDGCPLRPALGAELLVLAGDIHSGGEAVAAFKDWPVPVVYVGGNHESYGLARAAVNIDLAGRTAGTSFNFLECAKVKFKGLRVLGCTLWTDYELNGNAPLARFHAERGIADHQVIQGQDGLFTPCEAARVHRFSRRWLERELALPFAGKTVVVTHHGPHPEGVAPAYTGSPLNPAFFSDLRALMPSVDLWIHGHTHQSVDIQEGRCRVLANPLGYPMNRGQAARAEELIFENRNFDPKLVVDV